MLLSNNCSIRYSVCNTEMFFTAVSGDPIIMDTVLGQDRNNSCVRGSRIYRDSVTPHFKACAVIIWRVSPVQSVF